MPTKLAIVIPAFKAEFFKLTLLSLTNQTNNNFNIYIGDDNSPENLEKIASEFSENINLKYFKFKENLGQKSMVQQWDRCISLTENEPWIWVIGDDDLIDKNCVEYFYNELEKQSEFDLYRFNMRVIDALGNKIYDAPRFPETETGLSYIKARLRWERSNALCPYVFSRNIYIEKNGFVEFDLGWCSDDATWFKFAGENGIKTIAGPEVSWRYGANISSDIKLIERKINSWIEYSIWLVQASNLHGEERSELVNLLKSWIIRNVKFSGGIKSLYLFKKKLRKSTSLVKLNWFEIVL